jgi:hypothetical protein
MLNIVNIHSSDTMHAIIGMGLVWILFAKNILLGGIYEELSMQKMRDVDSGE